MSKVSSDKTLFNPDLIGNSLWTAIQHDLGTQSTDPLPTLKYGGGFHNEPTVLAAQRQVSEFMKKYLSSSKEAENKKRQLTNEAYLQFSVINAKLGELELALPEDLNLRPCDYGPRSRILIKAQSVWSTILGELDIERWFDLCRHGPGSTTGIKFVDTSVEAKMTYPVTVTPNCCELLVDYLMYDKRMLNILFRSALKHDHYKQRFTSERRDIGESRYRFRRRLVKTLFQLVPGSKLTTVDKDDRKRRTIAPVPTGNAFLQGGLMLYMYELMACFDLDVEKLPDRHKLLAFLGSLYPELLATLDLSEASNCVHRSLVRFLAGRKWFAAFDATRCEVTENPLMGFERLNMLGTMGDATTFPVETLLFYSIAVSIVDDLSSTEKSLLVSMEHYDSVSVFGDDIVVPQQASGPYMEFMKSLGFIINEEKSFFDSDDHFRESCGADYYCGHNVRPFHLRAPINNRISSLEPWLYIILNNLFKKYMSYFGDHRLVYGSRAFRYIFTLFREYDLQFKVVPLDYPEDSGFIYAKPSLRFSFAEIGLAYPDRYIVDHDSCEVAFNYCSFNYNCRGTHTRSTVGLWLAFRNSTRADTLKAISDTCVSQYWNHRPETVSVRDQEFWLLGSGYPSYYRKKVDGGYVVKKGLGSRFYHPIRTDGAYINGQVIGRHVAKYLIDRR